MIVDHSYLRGYLRSILGLTELHSNLRLLWYLLTIIARVQEVNTTVNFYVNCLAVGRFFLCTCVFKFIDNLLPQCLGHIK